MADSVFSVAAFGAFLRNTVTVSQSLSDIFALVGFRSTYIVQINTENKCTNTQFAEHGLARDQVELEQ